MTDWLELASLVLLIALVLGLVRIWRGPTLGDRMLAAQLFGSTGVGFLLLQAELSEQPALRDVALVLALLAIMTSVAFVARARPAKTRPVKKRQRDVD